MWETSGQGGSLRGNQWEGRGTAEVCGGERSEGRAGKQDGPATGLEN